MIKKLLITLKYGETKVKMYLIGVIVLLAAGIALMVMGISSNSLIFLGSGAVLLIAGLLVMFSFSFVDIDVDVEKKASSKEKKPNVRKEDKAKGKEKEKEKAETEESLLADNIDIDFSMLEDDLSDLAIGVGGKPLMNDSKKKQSEESDKKGDEEEELAGGDDERLEALLKDREESDDYGIDTVLKEDDETGAGTVSNAKKKNDVYEVKKPTSKQIKARKKMLKVRKDDRRYTPVFIDSWKEARVLHTPAFIQDKGKIANIILVEGALRTEMMPMSEFLECTYQRNVEERYEEVYEEIKKDSDVNSIFGELLPSLYQGDTRGNSTAMHKNLYILGGKLAITPRSLRKLFNKFDFVFHVFDSLEIRGKYSDYFKQAYESRIFWTDNVISQNDYQERIRRTLQSMVDDKNLTTGSFYSDIELMVRYNLITREYADYYKARKNDNIKIRI